MDVFFCIRNNNKKPKRLGELCNFECVTMCSVEHEIEIEIEIYIYFLNQMQVDYKFYVYVWFYNTKTNKKIGVDAQMKEEKKYVQK